MAKFMWRQGFVRCPESCSSDTPVSSCRCDCPAGIRAAAGSSYDLLEDAGALGLWSDDNINDMFSGDAYYDNKTWTVDYDDLLDKLCSIGLPGEMFTSSAPMDPVFWPLHGNAERFLQYIRVLNGTGNLTFDDTWGYHHQSQVASDTGVVCDWDGVDDAFDSLEMPTCVFNVTCPGHKEDDVLPFLGLLDGQTRHYTNGEFFHIVAPDSDVLPYVYNSLSYWPGCPNNRTISITDIEGEDDDAPAPTSAPPAPAPARR